MKVPSPKWIPLLLVVSLVVLAKSARSQTLQMLTQKVFNEQALSALKSQDEKQLTALIQGNKYRVEPLVVRFLNSYLKAELSQENEVAKKEVFQAQKLAQIFQSVFSDERLLRRIVLWQSWSKKEKKQKVVADSLLRVGWDSYLKGEFKQAKADFEKALKICQTIDDKHGQCQALNRIGVSYRALSDYPYALDFLQQSFQLGRKIGDDKANWINLTSIGNVYEKQGNIQQAKSYYEQALEIIQVVGDQRDLSVGYGNLGVIYKHLGDYSQALSYCLRALQIDQKIGDRPKEQSSWLNLGTLYTDLGERESALDCFQRSLQIAQEDSDKHGQANCLTNIGTLYLDEGKYEQALPYFEQSLALSREIGDRWLEGIDLTNLGIANKRMKNYSEALKYFGQALSIQKEIGDKISIALDLGQMGMLHVETKEYPKAKRYCQEALQVASQINSPVEIGNAQEQLGIVLKENGETVAALQYLTEAVKTVESIHAKLQEETFKAGFMDEQIAVYESLIDLLVTQGKYEEAFNYSERAKARSLLTILSLRNLDITEGISPERLNKKKAIEQKLTGLYDGFSQEYAKPENEQNRKLILALEDSLKFLTNDYETLLQEIRQNHPRYAELVGAKEPLSLRHIQQRVLDASTALVEYFVGEGKTFIWIVGKNSLQHETVAITREELKKMVSELLQPLLQAQEQKNLADIGFDLKLSQQLYEKLFQPVEKYLPKGSSVIIVPDDILFHLPFEALVTSVEKKRPDMKIIFSRYENAHFLVEKYSFSYSPSASVIDPMLQQPGKRDKMRGQLLAFGNPDFGKLTAKDVEEKEKSGILDLFALLFRSSKGRLFASLPKSEEEVKAISDFMKPSSVFTREKALEEKFKEEAGHFSLVHLSTHAVAEEKQPMYSRIIFAQDDDPNEDGFLHTYEVFNLKLNADLVTLSACETGLGKLSRGEGLIGLTRGFIYAGASSVLVSLWSVDESTAALMKIFYQNLKAGMSKAEALRQAKLKLIRTRENGISFAHPFLWAPFVLVGEM